MITEKILDENYEKFFKYLEENIKEAKAFKKEEEITARYYIIFNKVFLTQPCGFYQDKKLINFTKGVKDKSIIHSKKNIFKYHKFLELDDDFQKKPWFGGGGGGKKKGKKTDSQNTTKGASNWFGKYKREKEKSKDVEKIEIDEMGDGFTEEDDDNFVDDDIMEDDDIE